MNTSIFYVVKPQRGNIHGLIPQPPAKQFTMMKRTYTLKLPTHDIRSSYQLLIYPRASESPSLLPIRDVSYTSRKQLPIQDAHVSRKISCLPIRILPTLDKTSLLDYPSPPDSNQGSLALSTKLHSLC